MAAPGGTRTVREILASKLDDLSSVSPSSPSFIFRAPCALRQVNERAYEPQIISIGPYHHGKDHLEAMEIHKVRYLSNLLQRCNDHLDTYIALAMSMEGKARDCYVETINMESVDFVGMMVLDGLFLVELISKFEVRYIDENDVLFKQNLNLSIVAHDLLLLENQLPFFVLKEFAVRTGLHEEHFVQKALRLFSGMVPAPVIPCEEDHPVIRTNKHLLGLVHDNWLLAPLERHDDSANLIGKIIHFMLGSWNANERNDNSLNLIEIIRHLAQGSQKMNVLRQPSQSYLKNKALRARIVEYECNAPQATARCWKWNFMRSATELLEVGIRFKKGRGNSLFDIEFAKGQLEIPILIVNHDTERIFRNLIAYEQFNHGFGIVMDYARFMDCLINYADDVALLTDCGIIDNWLGSNEEVANMFNKLNDYVYLSTTNFYYSQIFDDVTKHCRRPWNLWKVKFRQTYFQSPWDWILTSIVAASILLLLSLVQTIFSVLAYFKQK